jgi:hypothetical protein
LARIRAATNLTGPGREPLSGGERNAAFTAGRVAEAAASVGAHIVLWAGDQHILDAVAKHLPGPFGPITTIAAGPVPEDGDERLRAQIATALDEITGEAVSAVGDLVASACAGPAPGAVRGIEAVAWQLTEQQTMRRSTRVPRPLKRRSRRHRDSQLPLAARPRARHNYDLEQQLAASPGAQRSGQVDRS